MNKQIFQKSAGSFPCQRKGKGESASLTLETICPDFREWPDSWKGEDKMFPLAEEDAVPRPCHTNTSWKKKPDRLDGWARQKPPILS